MPQFQHDEILFNYRETGSGIAFAFQHGLGADLNQPFSLFRPPPGLRMISFDCRAHGATSMGDPEGISLASFADDLRELLDYLEVNRAVIGGISMGAAVAINFALRFPERVDGLVLSRPAWLDAPNPWNVKMFSLVARMLLDHGPRQGQIIFKQTPEFLETARLYPEVAKSMVSQFENPRAVENVINLQRIPRDVPNADRRDWSKIQVPTLILANRHDPVHPFDYGETLARAIPGAELKEIQAKSINTEQHAADVQRFLNEFFQTNFLC